MSLISFKQIFDADAKHQSKCHLEKTYATLFLEPRELITLKQQQFQALLSLSSTSIIITGSAKVAVYSAQV